MKRKDRLFRSADNKAIGNLLLSLIARFFGLKRGNVKSLQKH